MDKHKAIPQGYMTVGEVAKKMDVTVRTLQHYDREGLLSPSAMSEGGRRLYTDKDIVKLHQILSLKHLGFSLDDIKNRLIPLDTPAEIAAVLTEQAAAVKQKIDSLSESLRELEVLREEVLQMQSVDFKKYADLMNEKFVQLAEPEQLEEYLFTACDQTAVLYHAELAAALARLPEQTQEEIFRYYFLRQPQRVIGVHIGRTRSTAGRHKIRYLLDRQCSIIKSTTIKIYGGKYEKEIQHVA